MTKVADLGGDGSDMPFEQAFSNLAHAYIKDKAPGLLDYEVGFQLVDRTDDNKKAIGVFGFKVGSSWLLVPVFFLAGDLKGHEILYIKNQDTFVPLKENWINYILNKKPLSLGEGVGRNPREIGIRNPDYSQFAHSPSTSKSAAARARRITPEESIELAATAAKLTKAAAATMDAATFEVFDEMPAWAKVATHSMAVAMARDPRTMPAIGIDFPAMLKLAGVDGAKATLAMCSAYPTVARAIDQFYPRETIDEAIRHIKQAATRVSTVLDADDPMIPSRYRVRREPQSRQSVLTPSSPVKQGSLQVYAYDPGQESNLPATIAEKDYDKLLRDGVLIKDTRKGDDEVSIAYHTTTTRQLVNPDVTGLYDVMVAPDLYEKMLVILGPHGPYGRRDFCTVIALDGAKGWLNLHPTYVWVSKQHSTDDLQDWADSLPEADSIDDGQYVLLSPEGTDGTLPFVHDSTTAGKIINVHFDLFSGRPRQAYMRGESHQRNFDTLAANNDEQYDRWNHGERINLGGRKGTTIRSNFGDVFIPKGWKKFKIEEADYADDQWDAPEYDGSNQTKRVVKSLTGGLGQSKTPPITGANVVDVELGIWQKVSSVTDRLEIRATGTRIVIDGTPFTKRAALIELVRDRGLREVVARDMIADAEGALVKRGASRRAYRVRYAPWVKAAAGGPFLTHGAPSAPPFPDPESSGSSFMGTGFETQQPQEMTIPVDDMKQDQTEARESQSPYTPDPMAAQVATQAAQTGQKEIFDTAMVGSLLKTTRDDLLVDKHLGALLKGLDKIGRLLFLLYWHQDEFADRYGKEAVPELEDSLRNTFESLGDLVLFLKQRTIDPYPDGGTSVDLKDTANA